MIERKTGFEKAWSEYEHDERRPLKNVAYWFYSYGCDEVTLHYEEEKSKFSEDSVKKAIDDSTDGCIECAPKEKNTIDEYCVRCKAYERLGFDFQGVDEE